MRSIAQGIHWIDEACAASRKPYGWPVPAVATVAGFSLHANTAVPGGDRQRLQRLVQYCARPAVATERLEPLPDGRLLYRFKRPWSDGTTHVILEPSELMEK